MCDLDLYSLMLELLHPVIKIASLLSFLFIPSIPVVLRKYQCNVPSYWHRALFC